ncbi:MAG: c-type cytochrome [Geopsychrobacter sp.]|nr:c-type cytochrome [Geopsychrobacter sp.]
MNRFFYLMVAACLAITLYVLAVVWRENPDHSTRVIADIVVNLNGKKVREHCTFCHPGGALAISVSGETTRSLHPDIGPHLPEKLGCTACHLGEGMALDRKISHGLPGLGARKVLRGRDLQASCFQCHKTAPLMGAEKAWQGYRLFIGKACNTCHYVGGAGRGGRYGPDLSRIGSFLGLEQIQEAIRDPKKDPQNSIMPRFPLSKGQARKIAFFLKSRIENPYYATPMQVQAGLIRLPEVSLVPKGRKLVEGEALLYRKQCLSCHKFREQDGRIAPDLSFIGQIRDPVYLHDFLENPSKLIPGAIMPHIFLTDDEEHKLVSFLAQQAVAQPTIGGEARESVPEVQRGKQLYMRFCQSCHAADGDGRGVLQPNLANFPRAFTGNADYFKRLSPEQMRRSIDQGIPGTSMPGYGKLVDPVARDRVIALIYQAFIGGAESDKAALDELVLPDSPLPAAARIDDLFNARCRRCHGIAGTGVGPEALRHKPMPRNLTNKRYFGRLSDQEIARILFDGVPGTAMPAFRDQLTSQEIWGLVGKIRTLSRTSIP